MTTVTGVLRAAGVKGKWEMMFSMDEGRGI